MQPISPSIQHLPQFDNHRALINLFDAKTGLRGFIAIHRGGLQLPAFGASRAWSYAHMDDALRDVLRLSQIMSYKSALAGLPYGGAKAVLVPTNGALTHGEIVAYAKTLNYLNGHFVTGADVGFGATDIQIMKKYYSPVVGLHADPVAYTILGMKLALDEVLMKLFDTTALTQRTFAIQGLGKTGWGLLETLRPHAKNIYVTDLDDKKVREASKLSSNVIGVKPRDIYAQRADIFSPCALGGTINLKTVKLLRCRAIVGMANCQLEDAETGKLLFAKGILYAPDYIINAGGLITVTDEYIHGRPSIRRIKQKIAAIPLTLRNILRLSTRRHIPPNIVADEKAKKIADRFT